MGARMSARVKYFAVTMLISMLLWAGIVAVVWVLVDLIKAAF